MSIIFLLIPLSIAIASGFLAGFIWAVRSGQYEDTATPSMRVLLDDCVARRETKNNRLPNHANTENERSISSIRD